MAGSQPAAPDHSQISTTTYIHTCTVLYGRQFARAYSTHFRDTTTNHYWDPIVLDTHTSTLTLSLPSSRTRTPAPTRDTVPFLHAYACQIILGRNGRNGRTNSYFYVTICKRLWLWWLAWPYFHRAICWLLVRLKGCFYCYSNWNYLFNDNFIYMPLQ